MQKFMENILFRTQNTDEYPMKCNLCGYGGFLQTRLHTIQQIILLIFTSDQKWYGYYFSVIQTSREASKATIILLAIILATNKTSFMYGIHF